MDRVRNEKIEKLIGVVAEVLAAKKSLYVSEETYAAVRGLVTYRIRELLKEKDS